VEEASSWRNFPSPPGLLQDQICRLFFRRTALTPRSHSSPSEAQGKSTGAISYAVTSFLADLRLSGSERVLGALALSLAESMEAAPPYARGKIARELREVVNQLAEAELNPANLSLLEGVEL
jgi:hypothetical protein